MFTFWFIVSVAMCGSLVLESQAKSVKWGPINWGPMKVSGHIGNMSKKYWPLTDRDKEASHNARNYAENYRPNVKTGWQEIPPLDPYFDKHLKPIRIHDHEVKGKVQLSNLSVVGAKKYKVVKMQVRLKKEYRLDFILKIPHLKSKFDLHANVKVDRQHNSFKAHVNQTLHKVVIKGALTFKSWPKSDDPYEQKLSVVASEYNVKSSNVQYNARDLAKNTRRVGHSSSDVVKKIAQKIGDKLAHASALSIMKLLTKALSHYSTGEILDMLEDEEELKLSE